MNKYIIEALEWSVNGYTHAVKCLTSTDGGRTWYYSGNGKYFRNEVAAKSYKRKMEGKNEID